MSAIVSRLVLQLALGAMLGAGQLVLGMAAAGAGAPAQPVTSSATGSVPQEPVGFGWG